MIRVALLISCYDGILGRQSLRTCVERDNLPLSVTSRLARTLCGKLRVVHTLRNWWSLNYIVVRRSKVDSICMCADKESTFLKLTLAGIVIGVEIAVVFRLSLSQWQSTYKVGATFECWFQLTSKLWASLGRSRVKNETAIFFLSLIVEGSFLGRFGWQIYQGLKLSSTAGRIDELIFKVIWDPSIKK